MGASDSSAPRSALAWLVAAGLVLAAAAAHAVPSFAVQTGRPCEACHVGGLGPQLTPFGREFKLHGYTARAVSFNVPLAGLVQSSYVSTAKGQNPPTPTFGKNDNFAVDQISLFVAGGIGDHFGAFIQTTYSGIAHAFTWDNLDVRAVTNATIAGVKSVLGISVNNTPTVQDAFNTLPAWGFPYTSSALAPSPAAAPLIGSLGQTTIGVTSYAWINDRLYVEFGGYQSPSSQFLIHVGADPTAPGNINGTAPYGRVAYQWNLGDSNVELGAFGFEANIFPGHNQSRRLTDHYGDLGFDASYQYFAPNHDVITLNGRYTYENQHLDASTALGLAAHPRQTLQDIRFDASYYWRDKVGFTIQVFDTWGSPDDLLFEANRRNRPDSSGILLQVDDTPFGNGRSPLGPAFNLRVGTQYTDYFQFDGAATNFDRVGRNASDNNTLRIFVEIAY